MSGVRTESDVYRGRDDTGCDSIRRWAAEERETAAAYSYAHAALITQLTSDDVAVERLLLRAFRLGVADGGDGRDFASGQEVAATLTGFGLTPKLHGLLRNVYNAGSAWRRGTLLDASKRLR